MYVCVYAQYTHTHTHTAHAVIDVSTRHLKGPKNPDGLNLSIYIFEYVYKLHVREIMLFIGKPMGRSLMITSANFSFKRISRRVSIGVCGLCIHLSVVCDLVVVCVAIYR